ncbi:MAG: DUF934 domain-containing protein, partial [Arenicella sp.]|nr:DUF934 domain-containing protein [Arenicella sp.]
MAANRAIKARAKASPDRIQQDIANRKVIKQQSVLDNDFIHLAENDDLTVERLPDGNFSVPMNFWKHNKQHIVARDGITAVQIAADQFPQDIADDLHQINMIVLPLVNFVDGRAYSHAQKLRRQFLFAGEIRAVGDVHLDQLGFLSRCGCDAFELPDGDDLQAALNAFSEFSEVYQPAAD